MAFAESICDMFMLQIRVVPRPGFCLLAMHDLADQLAPIFTFRTHTRVGSEPLTLLGRDIGPQSGYLLQLPACRKIHCYESLFVVS